MGFHVPLKLAVYYSVPEREEVGEDVRLESVARGKRAREVGAGALVG